MAVDAILTYGVKLYYSTDNVSFTVLSDMKQIGAAGSPERPDADVTPLDPSDLYREFKQGLATSGECECMQFYNKTRMTLLDGYFSANTILYWRIVLPDATLEANRSKVQFAARIKRLTTSTFDDPDKPVTIDFNLKISGKPTFTAGS